MIDTEALRKKVIDLAIQGKLTEQLSGDGDAETLYAQILDQKSQLIKEGKIKKDKALPDIAADEIPYEVPENWKWVRAGSILRVINGTSYAKGDISDKGIRILRGGNIQDSKVFYYKDDVFISESYADEEKKVQENDVLIVASTGSSTGIGKSGVVESTDDNAQIGAFLRIIRAHSPLISKYIDVYYMSDLYRNKIRDLAKGMNINNIKESYITEMLLPLPPLEEQKRIVKRLNDAFDYIGSIEDLQAKYSNNLVVLKSKIIDAGIRGKLTEQLPEDGDAEDLYVQIQEQKSQLIKEGKIKKEKPLPDIATDEIPFEIPKNWKWVRWGTVVNVVSARRVHQSDWKKEGIPFYRAREIAKLADTGNVDNDLFISEELYDDFSKSGVPHCGDLMVTGVGTLGKTYVVKENEKFYYKDASVLCFENYAGLVATFLKHLMDSDTIHAQINSNSGGTTVDTLTMVRMNQYLMPLPPLEEQRRIVARIDAILEQLNC